MSNVYNVFVLNV
uniref:Uncharacterized protein n=1 Tax=Anguilla anguilla TaxID=7936 RepID=A0A0E9U4T6_ANGAN